MPANRASIRVMEKLGMKFEREITHRGIPGVMYAIDSPPRTP
jgi:RimJ/RimL family protein N-acetyltransferase